MEQFQYSLVQWSVTSHIELLYNNSGIEMSASLPYFIILGHNVTPAIILGHHAQHFDNGNCTIFSFCLTLHRLFSHYARRGGVCKPVSQDMASIPPDSSSGGASVLRVLSLPGDSVLGQKLPPQGESSPVQEPIALEYFLLLQL